MKEAANAGETGNQSRHLARKAATTRKFRGVAAVLRHRAPGCGEAAAAFTVSSYVGALDLADLAGPHARQDQDQIGPIQMILDEVATRSPNPVRARATREQRQSE
jgi:hypothetical protein